MSTSVVTNPIIGGGVEPHIYDYSNDRKISSLVSYMQDNGYRFALVTRIGINTGDYDYSSAYCAQRIFPIEELEYIQNHQNTYWNTGISIPGVSTYGSNTQYKSENTTTTFCGTKDDKLISTGFTIYLF